MLVMILNFFGMLAITLLIQYFTHRINKFMNFFTGHYMVFVICVLGILSEDPVYFTSVLGYMCGDLVGNALGWHKPAEK